MPRQAFPKQRILLMDGHSLAYRAFFALPSDLRTSTGQVTNAVYGFTSMLIKALDELQVKHVAVAFDRGAPVERLAIRPEYKAQRTSAPDEFRQQVDLIHEVLQVLRIPVFEIEGTEADDIIGVIARRIAGQGHDVVIMTADRDFFQLVGANIRLMMNRRGISETEIYDEAAVRHRFGFGPEKYLDYAALRGDPSDNIRGVPGVGEKTALRLVHQYGSLEGIFDHLEELTPKIRQTLAEARERVMENRDFFRLRDAGELEIPEVELGDVAIGEWDTSEIRKLFDSLEFRTLFERLLPEGDEGSAEPFQAEVRVIENKRGQESLADLVKGSSEPIALAVDGNGGGLKLAIYAGGLSHVVTERITPALRDALSGRSFFAHGAKDVLKRFLSIGLKATMRVAFDTEIAAYLLEPAHGAYPLDEVVRRYLRLRLAPQANLAEDQGSLLEEPADPHRLGIEAAAVSRLVPVMSEELERLGQWELLGSLELPLTSVLAEMEISGIKIDASYLEAMGESMEAEIAALAEDIHRHAGGPVNINSPQQLREVLYGRLGLKPKKKTKTGYSTDAGVLEGMRDEHPIIDSILSYRERAKLKSTYIDALPRMVDPRTGRLHCHFNQTVAATGRLSSDSPNLQNIPIRTEEGRRIRRAFIAEEGHLLVKCDYSQIELRILAHLSGDAEMTDAFQRGDDIHRASIAKALNIPEEEVTPELRNVGKMVSFGVTYGMGPFGLSQRLRIPVDQARSYIDGFFALYPRVRSYLDETVAQAADDGFTTTLLGRRRYLPELKSRNPRLRGLGERMALNAPIQGSAADVLKLAMVRVAEMLEPPSRMLLTVHDELVLETTEELAAPLAFDVGAVMSNVVDLTVPLQVDSAWGPNWAEVKGA